MSFSLYNRFRQLEKVRVDKDALEGYLGATSTGGVLRTSSPLSYTDGGNYITLGLDTTADYTFGTVDTTEIFNSGGDLKIEPDVQGDVTLFEDTNVADAGDGKALFVHRKAAEADKYIKMYIDQYGNTRLAIWQSTAFSDNVLLGVNSTCSLTTGANNLFLGAGAGEKLTITSSNVAIGASALYGAVGCSAATSVAIGTEALRDIDTGSNNVAIGSAAMRDSESATENVAIGAAALKESVSGSQCVGIGYNAGLGVIGSTKNTAIGMSAGMFNDFNDVTAIGMSAGKYTGLRNTCIGAYAGQGRAGNTTVDSVFIGYRAGYTNNGTSSKNVGVGVRACYVITSGSNNTAVGTYAGYGITSGTGNVLLGYNAGKTNLTTGNNQLWITNVDTATPLIYGEFPNTLFKITATNANVVGTTNLGDGGTTNYASFATDGELTLAGTARVINGQWIDAQAIKAPTTNPAELISHGNLETPAFQFADAIEGNQENVTFNMRIPNCMDRGVAPTILIGWSADGESPGNCRWQLEYLYSKPNDDTGAVAQATAAVTGTASVTIDGMVISTFPALALPEATDICIHCRITRLSADELDTISDTVELHGVCFNWTSNKLGTATT